MDTAAPNAWLHIEDELGVFWTGPTLDEDRRPQALWFDCKACRDGGSPQASVLSWADLVAAVDNLWQEAVPVGRPKRGRVVTAYDGTAG